MPTTTETTQAVQDRSPDGLIPDNAEFIPEILGAQALDLSVLGQFFQTDPSRPAFVYRQTFDPQAVLRAVIDNFTKLTLESERVHRRLGAVSSRMRDGSNGLAQILLKLIDSQTALTPTTTHLFGTQADASFDGTSFEPHFHDDDAELALSFPLLGRLAVAIGEPDSRSYTTLNPGDALLFRARLPHSFVPLDVPRRSATIIIPEI